MFCSKFHDFWHESSSNLQTNPKWLDFAPKTSFCGLICGCLRWKRTQKISCQNCMTLSCMETIKVGKVENQAKITWFWTRNNPHAFDQFLIISLEYDWKMFWSKFNDFRHENFSKLETNLRSLGFAPKHSAHYFLSFCCVSRQ